MKQSGGTEKLGGIGSDAVRARTGKGWKEWLALLDKAGAKKWPHREIADYMHKKQGVPGWWAQMVTVGYEQARGLREKHQKPGGFEISGSKTVAVPIGKLYAAWEDKKARDRWLGAALTIRKATRNKSMRITWADNKSSVSVNFYPKGTGKSQVSVQHGKLPDAKAGARYKSYWAGRLDRLKTHLET